MHQDQQIIHVLMTHFAKLSLYFHPSSLSSSSCSLSSFVCHHFSPQAEVTEAAPRAPAYWHLTSYTTCRCKLCFVYLYLCACGRQRRRSEGRARGLQSNSFECVWLSGRGVPVKLQNHLNWERNAGMLTSDSDRSQISQSEKVPNQPPCNFTVIGEGSGKRSEGRGGGTEGEKK